jgi:Tol biopolymer transport system component
LLGLAAALPAVASLGEEATQTKHRGSYSLNGQIHVNTFGTPDGKPLTRGHQDMKPSWSKTGDRLVFFRLGEHDPNAGYWRTSICVIGVDGTGFRKLTDGSNTDFNPTWSRDGENAVVFSRLNRKTGAFCVMLTQRDGRPGDEHAVSDTRRHSFANSCLADGRILVKASNPGGYYLMTPARDNRAKYEPIRCALAKRGLMDRISASPSEKRVCFEFQRGFGKYRYPGRVIYIADFDAKARTITNPKAIANEQAEPHKPYLYPRWTRDESAVVYHCNKNRKRSTADDLDIWDGGNQIYMYRLADGSTRLVSTDPNANYMYPHGERAPK